MNTLVEFLVELTNEAVTKSSNPMLSKDITRPAYPGRIVISTYHSPSNQLHRIYWHAGIVHGLKDWWTLN